MKPSAVMNISTKPQACKAVEVFRRRPVFLRFFKNSGSWKPLGSLSRVSGGLRGAILNGMDRLEAVLGWLGGLEGPDIITMSIRQRVGQAQFIYGGFTSRRQRRWSLTPRRSLNLERSAAF